MRRGVVLLEILLSLAVFVGAALAVSGAVGRTLSSLSRAQERTIAADLAWSAVAQVEAGVLTPAALNGPAELDPGWEIAVDTTPTAHGRLVLLEVSVRPTGSAAAVYTARQLIALRSLPEPGAREGTAEERPGGGSPWSGGGT